MLVYRYSAPLQQGREKKGSHSLLAPVNYRLQKLRLHKTKGLQAIVLLYKFLPHVAEKKYQKIMNDV